jgi:hypothetical protein
VPAVGAVSRAVFNITSSSSLISPQSKSSWPRLLTDSEASRVSIKSDRRRHVEDLEQRNHAFDFQGITFLASQPNAAPTPSSDVDSRPQTYGDQADRGQTNHDQANAHEESRPRFPK